MPKLKCDQSTIVSSQRGGITQVWKRGGLMFSPEQRLGWQESRRKIYSTTAFQKVKAHSICKHCDTEKEPWSPCVACKVTDTCRNGALKFREIYLVLSIDSKVKRS